MGRRSCSFIQNVILIGLWFSLHKVHGCLIWMATLVSLSLYLLMAKRFVVNMVLVPPQATPLQFIDILRFNMHC